MAKAKIFEFLCEVWEHWTYKSGICNERRSKHRHNAAAIRFWFLAAGTDIVGILCAFEATSHDIFVVGIRGQSKIDISIYRCVLILLSHVVYEAIFDTESKDGYKVPDRLLWEENMRWRVGDFETLQSEYIWGELKDMTIIYRQHCIWILFS